MKKILTIGLLGLAMVLNVKGQGQVDFRNSNLTSPSGRFVYDIDGTTKIAGPNYVAQLYFSTTLNGSYTAVADPVAPFRAVGAGDGYWNPGASFIRNLPGTVGNQNVFLLVRVWNLANGATYDLAKNASSGNISNPLATGFAYTTGGDPGNGNPSTTAGAMSNFQGFNVVPVPEPSTIALGILGAGSLLFLRRRK